MDQDQPGPAVSPSSDVNASYHRLRTEVEKIVVGQRDVVEQLLLCLLCRGHAVLLGMPGLAKTLLISTLSRAMNLSFSRIQFTPDLMPSDITGTEVIEEDRGTGRREFRFVKGPVFANVILADEINRTPPKTQAALLEAMQDYHVSVGGTQHHLPRPFFVLATQNPIEQEGTYPLPEAQLDRFMFMIHVDYPQEDDELQIIKRTTMRREVSVDQVLEGADIETAQEMVRDVPVADHVIRHALGIVRATRRPGRDGVDDRPDFVRQYLSWGAGPRAGQYLVLGGKARAIVEGRTHVDIEDIHAVAHPVLRHRLILNFNAEADGVDSDELIDRLLDHVGAEGVGAGTQAARVLRTASE
ncbi:MAG: AAA family ATPase [Phycisphaeraceae bacterium]|nr:AAA family ATPase [Phycisphaeraceae bacterium]